MKGRDLLVLALAVALALSLVGNAWLAWRLVDQSVSLDGRTTHAAACETHRDALDVVLRRTARRSDIDDASAGPVSFQFDAAGRYSGSWYGSSVTKGFKHGP